MRLDPNLLSDPLAQTDESGMKIADYFYRQYPLVI